MTIAGQGHDSLCLCVVRLEGLGLAVQGSLVQGMGDA